MTVSLRKFVSLYSKNPEYCGLEFKNLGEALEYYRADECIYEKSLRHKGKEHYEVHIFEDKQTSIRCAIEDNGLYDCLKGEDFVEYEIDENDFVEYVIEKGFEVNQSKIIVKHVATYDNDYSVIEVDDNGKTLNLLDVEAVGGSLVEIDNSDVLQDGYIKVYADGDHCGENDNHLYYTAVLKHENDNKRESFYVEKDDHGFYKKRNSNLT
jgi:hypothetical protein